MPPKKCPTIDAKDLLDIEKSLITESRWDQVLFYLMILMINIKKIMNTIIAIPFTSNNFFHVKVINITTATTTTMWY